MLSWDQKEGGKGKGEGAQRGSRPCWGELPAFSSRTGPFLGCSFRYCFVVTVYSHKVRLMCTPAPRVGEVTMVSILDPGQRQHVSLQCTGLRKCLLSSSLQAVGWKGEEEKWHWAEQTVYLESSGLRFALVTTPTGHDTAAQGCWSTARNALTSSGSALPW